MALDSCWRPRSIILAIVLNHQGCRVQRRENKLKRALLRFGVVAVLVAILAYGLFHGFFDRGQFEVKDFQWSSNGKVAIVAERSDQAALTSYMYFVLIADHLLSPKELRRAYYNKASVFEAASSCVRVRWEGPNRLIVACKDGMIGADHIESQVEQSGPVSVAYKNIPIK
jgi:hypothetical protein